MALTLELLRRGGERLMQDVNREYYLAYAGLKPDAELQSIYERHARVIGGDALAFARDEFAGAPADSEQRRSARLLLEWQVELVAGRALAPLEEREIAWESSALVRLSDGSAIPYQRAAIQLANTTNRAERLAIESARARLVAEQLAPLKRERLQRERDLVEELEIANGYVATFEATSGVSLGGLARECTAFLRDTQSMWDDVYPERVRRSLGIPPAEATRADALALFRGREHDRHFPAGDMRPAIARQVEAMGVDPLAGGRVRYDVGEREGKRARAFCAPVLVPDEVYLVVRPHGGRSDWTTFLHELGHALHYAFMRPGLPFEYRWLGDNSVTEGFAMLFDHLMQDRGWLARYTSTDPAEARALQRSAAFEELHLLRRYCAKLLYEEQAYAGAAPWDALPDLYVTTLTAATTFRYSPADAFVDFDPRFYSARYLRAWQLQAALRSTLEQRFDDDWWRNPRAGPWIIEQLWSEGQRELAGELATRVGVTELSFAPIIASLERMLS